MDERLPNRSIEEGVKPYIRRALLNRKDGYEIIFFISFGHAISFTRKILDILTKTYGIELIKNSGKDYVIENSHLMCATVLTNPKYVLNPKMIYYFMIH